MRRLVEAPSNEFDAGLQARIAAAAARDIPFILARQESAAVIMAATEAELSGKPGAALVTRGPGVGNAANSMAQASLDRAPVLLLADGFPGAERAYANHQYFDQAAMLAPVTKGTARALEAGAAAGPMAATLLATAMAAPRGPVMLELSAGAAALGSGVRLGEVDQARGRFYGPEQLAVAFGAEVPDLPDAEVRTLLAKFGLRAEHVLRPAVTLSPGERTRAALALLQARGVNVRVLDEPTNHLDLPAIEQLEQALADYAGTLLLVTHDRRMLEAVRLDRR